MTPTTIPELVRRAAAEHPRKLALAEPTGKDVHTWTGRQNGHGHLNKILENRVAELTSDSIA
jgi:hypothetical protein